ncbi:unnamed protein product [Orchesella dallaii]|uniref:Protein SET n=1 Tax=Orchesella dallaii TaxID=48710 RepID=A0ABP1RB30_9HEXA
MSDDGAKPPKIQRVEDPNNGSNNEKVADANVESGNNDKRAEADAPTVNVDDPIAQALKEIGAIQTELDVYNEQFVVTTDVRNEILDRRAEAIARVPNFWRNVLKNYRNHENNEALPMHIRSSEEECLSSLRRVDVEPVWGVGDIQRQVGFRIRLTFGPNTYFDNTELTREYVLPIGRAIQRLKSFTPINWTPGKRLVSRYNHGSSMWPSFFEWYSFGSYDDNTIADVIREHLWVDPLTYYQAPINETVAPVQLFPGAPNRFILAHEEDEEEDEQDEEEDDEDPPEFLEGAVWDDDWGVSGDEEDDI